MKYLMKLESFTESKTYIKTFERSCVFENPEGYKVGDVVKIVRINKRAKEQNVKKGDLAEITHVDKNDSILSFRIISLKDKIGLEESYWEYEFWVTRKQIARPTQFEIDMIKYNL